MKKFLVVLLSVLCSVSIVAALTGCSNSGHVHSFDKQVVSEEYLAKEATCTEKAKYYYSCECGAKGTKTFEYGSATNHNFVSVVCTHCGREQESSKGLEFALLNDDTYEVSGLGGCSDTEIVIPRKYNDKPVTSIGVSAFENCNDLTSVILPVGLTGIDMFAFSGCGELTNISIPDTITCVDAEAFKDCNKLKYNKYDNAFYLGNEINPYAVFIKVKSSDVEDCAINKGCKAIICDNFLDSSWRGKLKNIYITDLEAWCRISGLLNLMDCYDGSDLINKNLYLNNEIVINLVIPDGITSIRQGAFLGFGCLTSVIIPDSVTTIERCAFYGCGGLKSVTIGSGVTYIDDNVFTDCISLTSIAIPDCVAYIGVGAFEGCSSLTSITIPDSVTSIYAIAFYGCSGLMSITIGKGVIGIGDSAFMGCSGLTEIIIPDSVTIIDYCAFAGCDGLANITIGKGVMSIGGFAFSNRVGLKSITYKGTIAEWENIKKENNWNSNMPEDCIIHCADGDIKIFD